jgi:hypothetical protein
MQVAAAVISALLIRSAQPIDIVSFLQRDQTNRHSRRGRGSSAVAFTAALHDVRIAGFWE